MNVLESARADVRYALRLFTRAPGFALGVVVVAALGIAVNAVVFAVLNSFFWKPVPVPRAGELVRVYTSDSNRDRRHGASSFPDYLDLRNVPALRGLAAFVPVAASVRLDGTLVRAEGRLVSTNFFDVLEAPTAVGSLARFREVVREEHVPVVVGSGFWRRHLGGDPAVVGRGFQINGASAVVVAVLAPPFVGVEPSPVDVYVPADTHRLVAPGFDFVDDRSARLVKLIGRMRDGATLDRVARDLNVAMAGLSTAYPATNEGRLITVTAGSTLVDIAASPLRIVPIVAVSFSVTGVLLLIATINVAGLMLARTLARRRELAVRLSLGASRFRIFRQLVVEGIVLGAAAEALALGVIAALPAIARAFAAPETLQLAPDLRVIAFASTLTFLAALGFSIGPALRGARRDACSQLRDGTSTAPPARMRAQRVLVVVQVMLATTLLSAAVLLGQSVRRHYSVAPGFQPADLLTAEFESARGTSTAAEDHAFVREALTAIRNMPGVIAAASTVSPPLTSEGARMTVAIPGFTPPDGKNPEVRFSYVGEDYCVALGLPIRQGAELRSGARRTVARGILVNETMARQYWPGRNPVGASIRLGGSGGARVPVIAIVADARMISLSLPPDPYFYVQGDGEPGAAVLIRTQSAAVPVAPALERAFSRETHGFVLRRVRSMEQIRGDSLADETTAAGFAGSVGVLAWILAASALYALLSYLAVQRTREFGIRLALGATRRQIVRLMLSSAIGLSAAGALLGVAGALIVAALLESALPMQLALDTPVVLALAAASCAVAVAASAIPAIRASRQSPAATLRAQL